jgi:hypothetical protein
LQLNELAAAPHPRRARGWHVIDEVDLAALLADQADTRALCAALERVADALPALPTAAEAEALGLLLVRFADCRQLRIERLAETLAKSASGPVAEAIIAHVHDCHALDSVHALDLAGALDEAMREQIGAPALSYMLRCAFDGCRRAVMFEQLALFHLAGQRMTPAAAATLGDGLILSSRIQ